MLDRKFIVENADLVKQNCVSRGVKADVDRFVELEDAAQDAADRSRGAAIARRTRSASRSARRRTPPNAKPARKKAGSSASRTQAAQAELDELGGRGRRRSSGTIPNLSHPDAPVGGDDQANLEAAPRQDAAAQVRLSSRSTTSSWPRSSTWSTSKAAPASPATASTSSRTKPCCWNWPCSSTRSTC